MRFHDAQNVYFRHYHLDNDVSSIKKYIFTIRTARRPACYVPRRLHRTGFNLMP
jgi:hypothetical protein